MAVAEALLAKSSGARASADHESDIEDCWVLHDRAVEEGKFHYTDPTTGVMVFTETMLRKRGYCCGSGCRHCPYHHANAEDKITKIQQPAILNAPSHLAPKVRDLVLFAGDAASVATLQRLLGDQLEEAVPGGDKGEPAALTQPWMMACFDAISRTIEHEKDRVHLKTVAEQAEKLGIGLIGIPLHRGLSAANRVEKGMEVLLGNSEGTVGAKADKSKLDFWFPKCSTSSPAKWETEMTTLFDKQVEVEGESVQVMAHYPLLELSEEERSAELRKSYDRLSKMVQEPSPT